MLYTHVLLVYMIGKIINSFNSLNDCANNILIYDGANIIIPVVMVVNVMYSLFLVLIIVNRRCSSTTGVDDCEYSFCPGINCCEN